MFSQAPKPYEPTSEYRVRSWSRPICAVFDAPTREGIVRQVNDTLARRDWHVVSLSPVSLVSFAAAPPHYLCTVLYQARNEETHVQ